MMGIGIGRCPRVLVLGRWYLGFRAQTMPPPGLIFCTHRTGRETQSHCCPRFLTQHYWDCYCTAHSNRVVAGFYILSRFEWKPLSHHNWCHGSINCGHQPIRRHHPNSFNLQPNLGMLSVSCMSSDLLTMFKDRTDCSHRTMSIEIYLSVKHI